MYELLKHSREYFVRYGGAKGASVHGNRVCAIGAVGMACTEEFFQQQLSPSASFLASTAETTQVLAALNDKVCETYDYNNIADVNDQLGEEAVLHVFDLCIKDCETR